MTNHGQHALVIKVGTDLEINVKPLAKNYKPDFTDWETGFRELKTVRANMIEMDESVARECLGTLSMYINTDGSPASIRQH